jgi:hypothetical protein
MNNPQHFLLLIATLFIFTACERPTTTTTTNMKIKSLDKPQIVKLYEKHSGKKIKDVDDFCVEEAPNLKGVYSLGWFAHDRGCMGNEILVGNKIGPWGKMMPEVLGLFGWQEEAKQEKLALNWVTDVILVWESPMSSGGEDFERTDAPKFQVPKVEKIDAGWRVSLWVRQPGGMLPQNDYYFFVVEIAKDGSLAATEIKERYTAKIKGYE